MNDLNDWITRAGCARANPRNFDTEGGWANEANWAPVTRWCMFCPVARECAADALANGARGTIRAVPLVTTGTDLRLSRTARDSLARIADGTSTPAMEATRAVGALRGVRGTPVPGGRPGPTTAHATRAKPTARAKAKTS